MLKFADMNIRNILEKRLSRNQISEIAARLRDNPAGVDILFDLTGDADERCAYNALWCLTHCDREILQKLQDRQDCLIDRVLTERHTGKKRLLLTLLEKQTYTSASLRSDFLDFCMSRITSQTESRACRALCLKLALRQCRFYPDLLTELIIITDMLNPVELTPGMKSATKKCRRIIDKIMDSERGR